MPPWERDAPASLGSSLVVPGASAHEPPLLCFFPHPLEGGSKANSARSTPERRPAGGTNKSLGFNDRTAERELQELSTAD